MTIERAIEILSPENLTDRTPAEWVQAHRMACQALALLRWIPVTERKPEPDEELVLVVCTARISAHHFFRDAIQLAEYDETSNEWVLEGWPEAEDVKVSHWMPLPELPDELGEEAEV